MTAERRGSWRQIVLVVAVFGGAYAFAQLLAQSPLIGKQAPDFGLKIASTEEGAQWFKLSEHEGRVVVLDFWASWCEACRESTGMLNDLAARFGQDPVSFIGVNVEQIGVGELRRAHASFGAVFPTVGDPQGTVQRAYSVRALPTVVVIDRAGKVALSSMGAPRETTLSAAISGALR